MKPIHPDYSSRIKENRRQPDVDNKTINRWENGPVFHRPLGCQVGEW